MPRRTIFQGLFVIAAIFGGSCVLLADNWPTWRGPRSNGISTEKNLPTEWSETKNVAWKLPLPGMGGSTPVIWNDRIFLTCSRDKDLLLFRVSTAGKVLWERKLGVTTRDVVLRENAVQANEACASPSTDGTHVYALVGSGDLACLDFDGNIIWKCNIQERYGKYNIFHGIHTSPLVFGDRLYLAAPALGRALGHRPGQKDRHRDLEACSPDRCQKRKPRGVHKPHHLGHGN